MLPPTRKFRVFPPTSSSTTRRHKQHHHHPGTTSSSSFLLFQQYGIIFSILFAFIWLFLIVHSHHQLIVVVNNKIQEPHEDAPLWLSRQQQQQIQLPFMKHKQQQHISTTTTIASNNDNDDTADLKSLPIAFEEIMGRARMMLDTCMATTTTGNPANKITTTTHQVLVGNMSVAALPAFGILNDIENYNNQNEQDTDNDNKNSAQWQCQVPPSTSCEETHMTVVFMAYNPDRLDKTLQQIQKMLITEPQWQTIVQQVILVWNGERHIQDGGEHVLQFQKENPDTFHIVYPIQDLGLPNDLMNRYHPDLILPYTTEKTKRPTKALLYYDDDGPFYSFQAVQAGFELWKRHSHVQVGAMARQITYSPRQAQEYRDLLGPHQEFDDTQFVSYCNDTEVEYNYRYFANYDANMVLPSGSFLHQNYLCFLWHPVLETVREFVHAHPVHPDDVTVSMVVSQLAGQAPRVYSRRLNHRDAGKKVRAASKRTLSSVRTSVHRSPLHAHDNHEEQHHEDDHRKRMLLFGIDWDQDHAMNDAKQLWADLRTQAVHSLIQYFGSLNSGSIGWCDKESEYYNAKVDGRCQPIMAKQGWLSWMNPDGTPKETCP